MSERFRIRPEWAEGIKELVAQAPPLSPAQVDKLAVLLRPTTPNPNTRAQPPKDAA